MSVLLEVVTAVVLVSSYITWLAARLDRLHVRCEAARDTLDAVLVRRAGAALTLAQLPAAPRRLPGEVVAEVAAAASGALAAADAAPLRVSGPRAPGAEDAVLPPAQRRRLYEQRAEAENRLSAALRAAVAAAAPPQGGVPDPVVDPQARELLAALQSAARRVAVARQFDADAVRDTRALRSHPVVRVLHLAGRAPLPQFFDIDDSVVPGQDPDPTTGSWAGAGPADPRGALTAPVTPGGPPATR